ncbi:DUF21 domain-containing protein, partial [bacterium]
MLWSAVSVLGVRMGRPSFSRTPRESVAALRSVAALSTLRGLADRSRDSDLGYTPTRALRVGPEDEPLQAFLTFLLLAGSAFFVSAEYALVSSRRARLETLARKGNATAKRLLPALDDLAPYVAGLQIGVTIVGIGMGSYGEPYISGVLERLMPGAPKPVQTAVSL